MPEWAVAALLASKPRRLESEATAIIILPVQTRVQSVSIAEIESAPDRRSRSRVRFGLADQSLSA